MIRFCNDCIHFGVCMGFSNCNKFERRENATMRITGYEVDGGKLSAVYITDETRGVEQKKYVEDRPQGKWISLEKTRCKGQLLPFWRTHECSICSSTGQGDFNFCPNCGARMTGEGEDCEGQ